MKENQVKLNSPVVGAFISSWILFNWDRFLLLFWGEGKVPERLKQFQENANFEDLQLWLWPLLIALVYVFGLPYLNILTQKIKRHAELLRYNEVVDTDIEKEKKLVELNEEKYKSNPENDYLGKKIKYELEKLEAEAGAQKSESEKMVAEAKQAIAITEQEEAKAKSDKLQLKHKAREDDREQQAHERTKAKHKNEMATLRFPTIYTYLKFLSSELDEQDILLKFSTLEKLTALILGYSTAEDLVTDSQFTQSKLSELSFFTYDDVTLLSDIRIILTEDNYDEINEEVIFDILIQLFEYVDYIDLITNDLLPDIAIRHIEDNSFDILELDAVNSRMAETNAFFDEINEFVVTSSIVDIKNGVCNIDMEGTVSGTNDEDKFFSGDTINVKFTLSYKRLIGNGFGQPEYINVKAEVAHPDDHSYLESEGVL
ncbi:hypothetical protein ACU5EH_15475 [Aliivibrio salmonicida]|uniref:hypothetical protein n=1 Tax=Aliivibrio salmonicida TaxID=40269 RepID=UPI00406CBDD4